MDGNDYPYDANEGRPLRKCPVDIFREEPECRAGNWTRDVSSQRRKIVWDEENRIRSGINNHLNLPRLITFDNGNTITYLYDATGVKLQKTVIESGQPNKTTFYIGSVVYENNVRKFVNTEEGRIVLETSTPEYQYHMKDHLGNVRLTFTTAPSAQQTSTYMATMEPEATTLEAATFNNIETTQQEDKIFNHTPGGKASARLNAAEDRVMGPSMTLQVMPGDAVRMSVQAKYFKKAKTKDPITGMAGIVAASLGAGAVSEAPQIAQGIQETLGLGQAALVSKDNSIPKAYINYLFFDKENNFKSGGYRQVSEAALGSFEELSLDFTPEEEGTMMIYTANQTAEDLDVYMDDMMVMHTEGPIIRVDDYYPFGLTFNTSERSGFLTNKFLYNGKELQTDLDLDWYDYGARMYMAEIGRFTTHDRYAYVYQSYSPFSYALNNPIRFEDTEGEGPGDRVKAANSYLGTPYSQAKSLNQGRHLRTSYSNAALRYLDCSELVYRVLYSDGIHGENNRPELNNTGGLSKLLNNDENFIKSQSPEVGDIFLWTNGNTGHTGIVTGVVEDHLGKTWVIITHAKGTKYGTVIEYQTVEYFTNRTGWQGFFRPKSETEDGKVDVSGWTAEEKTQYLLDRVAELKQEIAEKKAKEEAKKEKKEEKKKNENS